jgi:hypothetical protein
MHKSHCCHFVWLRECVMVATAAVVAVGTASSLVLFGLFLPAGLDLQVFLDGARAQIGQLDAAHLFDVNGTDPTGVRPG